MSNDKYQDLRDALKTTEFPCGEMIRSLLADHDRMREALQEIALMDSLTHSTWDAGHCAAKALKECGK